MLAERPLKRVEDETLLFDVGITASQVDDIDRFRGLVVEGDKNMNLVGPSFQADFWRRHALDSAQLFHVERPAERWADVGSGAGFPGIVLAILLKGHAGAEIHLVESMAKRVGFLREVCLDLDLPAVVHHARAEDLKAYPEVDVVTARACAPLDRLLDFTSGFLKAGARGLFLKGRSVQDEIAVARKRWLLDLTVIHSISDPEGRLVRITKAGRRA